MISKPRDFQQMIASATGIKGSFVLWSAWQPFSDFLVKSVHPNAEAFAWVLILLSLLAGALLLVGFLTRLAAIFACCVSLFFLLATWAAPAPNFSFHAALLCMEWAVLIAAAGRTFGFDRLLARRTKVKILW